MTDLLTRIRAYVAAKPTHYCWTCEASCTPLGDQCPACDSDDIELLTVSEATALLREVAALEPVGYVLPSDVHFLRDGQAYSLIWRKPTGQAGMPLYTLTGATHD